MTVQGEDGHVDVLLVCSAGGHLLQLVALREAWQEFSCAWITDPTSDAESLLGDELVEYAHFPTTRHLGNLLRNVVLAWRLVTRWRPRVVLTTGAGTAVPFAWIGRLRGARVVWIETVTRIHAPSLSCRMVAPIADRVYVQWPELASAVPKSRYVGTILEAG